MGLASRDFADQQAAKADRAGRQGTGQEDAKPAGQVRQGHAPPPAPPEQRPHVTRDNDRYVTRRRPTRAGTGGASPRSARARVRSTSPPRRPGLRAAPSPRRPAPAPAPAPHAGPAPPPRPHRAAGPDMTVDARALRRVRHLRLPGGTPRRTALADAARLAKRVVADIDATCSRFRDDSDLTRANRQPGTLGRRRPAPGRRRRGRVRAPPKQTGGLVPRCSGGRWCSSATTATSAELQRTRRPTGPVPLDRPRSRPGRVARRSASTGRAGSAVPGRHRARPRRRPARRGRPTWSRPAIERELGVPAVVSLGGDVRVAAPTGGRGRSPCPSSPERARDARSARLRRAGHLEHAGPPLVARRSCPPPPARPPHRRGRRRRSGAR